MSEPKHQAWVRHFDAIGDEVMRLQIACDVRLRDAGVIERILKNDATVCGRKDPIGFRKVRDLLKAAFDSVDKAAGRIGPDETKRIVGAVIERLGRRRKLGGTGAAKPASASGKSRRRQPP